MARIIRQGLPADHFTIIANDWVRDGRLSLRARGLLALLASHSEGWSTSLARLAEQNPEGVDAIRSAVHELESYGYLRRGQGRDDGKFGHADWVIGNPVTGVGLSNDGRATDVGLPDDGPADHGPPDSGPGDDIRRPSKEDQVQEDTSQEVLSPGVPDDAGVLIPADWRPNQRHVDHAASLHLDVAAEYQRFQDHAERTRRRLKNWNTGFTNWLRKAAEINQQKQGRRPAYAMTAHDRADDRRARNRSVIEQMDALERSKPLGLGQ